MRLAQLVFCLLMFLSGMSLFGDERLAQRLAFENESIDTWHGYTRHKFTIDGCSAWVAEPKKALPGNPWSWSPGLPDEYADRCAVTKLVENGFHHVDFDVGNTFGCPSAIKHLDVLYQTMIAKGFMKRCVAIGISRGGLFCYHFAMEDPKRVSVIYGDAAVCDFKSWPGGKVGVGPGSARDWTELIHAYGFTDEAEAIAYTGNPVDNLSELAKAKVAIIHLVGDQDSLVPFADNAGVVEKRYNDLHGTVQVIHKPKDGHHPHGMDDPTPLVDFIMKHGAGQQ